MGDVERAELPPDLVHGRSRFRAWGTADLVGYDAADIRIPGDIGRLGLGRQTIARRPDRPQAWRLKMHFRPVSASMPCLMSSTSLYAIASSISPSTTIAIDQVSILMETGIPSTRIRSAAAGSSDQMVS